MHTCFLHDLGDSCCSSNKEIPKGKGYSRVRNSLLDKGSVQLHGTSKGNLAINDMDVGSIYPHVSWQVTLSVVLSLPSNLHCSIHFCSPLIMSLPGLIFRLLVLYVQWPPTPLRLLSGVALEQIAPLSTNTQQTPHSSARLQVKRPG